MKKIEEYIILFILIITELVSFTGCNNSKYTEEHDSIEVNSVISSQFPDFTFDNNEGQYYMSENSAAAENGYYFITQNAAESGTKNFIYYYDMTSQTSVPLCSNIQCQHNDSNCDACITDEKCLGQMIWYYGGRLYMIERFSEKDILVSYDSEGRNKKEVCSLSQADFTVGYKTSAGGSACLNDGYLYYVIYNSKSLENNIKLKRIYLNSNAKVEEIGFFTMSTSSVVGNINCFKFYPINNNIYIFVREAFHSTGENTYRIFKYDIAKRDFNIVMEMKATEFSKICRGEINNWSNDNAIDNEGNVYYLSWIKGERLDDLGYNGICILNKYNTITKENKELYVLEGSETRLVSSDVLSISGYDNKYIYLYEGAKVTDKDIMTPLEDSNNILVMNTDGSIVDKFHLSLNIEFTNKYYRIYQTLKINLKILGGDERYLMISTTQPNIKSIEFSDKLMTSFKDWTTKATGKKISIVPEVVAVIDKNQIGTGSYSFIKVKE